MSADPYNEAILNRLNWARTVEIFNTGNLRERIQAMVNNGDGRDYFVTVQHSDECPCVPREIPRMRGRRTNYPLEFCTCVVLLIEFNPVRS